ncbi:hypothetical protein AMAG_03898 [Allomyces macrogynus ATCC 38327]|uniref:Uncharacterized protein n=1 Tax=Allomyces macrogynus (strain ATCC 38327) TaxID=578462 RepID=A0A0L0SAX7_ALLM3|nr:hypothetical protein AMAG_03898 [Allomyces macrogynus ATCC 38327]|eukprot:KNE59646.1 hypothetical protein AMAG_03898 [Allomyces macrogynus ATCC 38327]
MSWSMSVDDSEEPWSPSSGAHQRLRPLAALVSDALANDFRVGKYSLLALTALGPLQCAVLSQYHVFRDTTPETLLAIERINEYITDVTNENWASVWRETCGTSQTARDLHSTVVDLSSRNDDDDPAPTDYRELYLQWRNLESAKKTDLAARLRNAYTTSSSLTKRVQTTAVTRADMLGKRKWGGVLNPPAGSGAAQIKRARIQAQEKRALFAPPPVRPGSVQPANLPVALMASKGAAGAAPRMQFTASSTAARPSATHLVSARPSATSSPPVRRPSSAASSPPVPAAPRPVARPRPGLPPPRRVTQAISPPPPPARRAGPPLPSELAFLDPTRAARARTFPTAPASRPASTRPRAGSEAPVQPERGVRIVKSAAQWLGDTVETRILREAEPRERRGAMQSSGRDRSEAARVKRWADEMDEGLFRRYED